MEKSEPYTCRPIIQTDLGKGLNYSSLSGFYGNNFVLKKKEKKTLK